MCRRVKRPKRDYVYKRRASGERRGRVSSLARGSQSWKNVKLHSTTRKSFRVEGGRAAPSNWPSKCARDRDQRRREIGRIRENRLIPPHHAYLGNLYRRRVRRLAGGEDAVLTREIKASHSARQEEQEKEGSARYAKASFPFGDPRSSYYSARNP